MADYENAEGDDDDFQDARGGPAPTAPPAPPAPTNQSRANAPASQQQTTPSAQSAPRGQASQGRGNTGAQQQQQQQLQAQGSGSPKRKRRGSGKPPPCNCRIDELARPKRWIILNTWKEHGTHFDPERSQALRERVQEEFYMTPEETAAYLAQVRQHQQKSRHNDRVRKAEQRKEAKAARRAADMFIQKRIKRGLIYAYQNPPPILMSPMLRSISDRVLEELCGLHDVPIPKRGDSDKHSRYLLSAADWTAILTANIYYEVNVKEKEDIDRMIEADRCSYVDSEDEKAKNMANVKKEPKTKQQKSNSAGGASSYPSAPSEKQMGVTNYDDSEFDESEMDELGAIDEEIE